MLKIFFVTDQNLPYFMYVRDTTYTSEQDYKPAPHNLSHNT